MNILIIGQQSDNFGDDAAGIALIQRLLGFNSVEAINVLYRYENRLLPITDDRVFHFNKNVPNFKIGHRLRIPREIKHFFNIAIRKKYKCEPLRSLINEADLIYVSPCGANIGSYQDGILLITLLCCVCAGKDVITHLNTFDHYDEPVFTWIARYCLKRAKVYTREHRSVEYLKTQGIEAYFGIDSAYMFNNDQIENVPEYVKKDEYIAVILSAVNTWHRKYKCKQWSNDDYYIKIVMPLIEYAKNRNKSVVFIAHTPGDKEFVRYICQRACKIGLVNCFEKSNVKSVFEYDALIANSWLVISNRYHGLVLASKHEIPFCGLAYDTKSLEVSEYTGCSDFCVWMEDVMDGKTEFKSLIKKADDERTSIKKRLHYFVTSDIFKTVFKPTEIIAEKWDV